MLKRSTRGNWIGWGWLFCHVLTYTLCRYIYILSMYIVYVYIYCVCMDIYISIVYNHSKIEIASYWFITRGVFLFNLFFGGGMCGYPQYCNHTLEADIIYAINISAYIWNPYFNRPIYGYRCTENLWSSKLFGSLVWNLVVGGVNFAHSAG